MFFNLNPDKFLTVFLFHEKYRDKNYFTTLNVDYKEINHNLI